MAAGRAAGGDKYARFPDPELGKAVPYGVYDVAGDAGWVSVGGSADTAEFAVSTIRRWWAEVGSAAYPEASKLLITQAADYRGLGRIKQFPGSAVEKRARGVRERRRTRRRCVSLPTRDVEGEQDRAPLFSHISMNWRGRVLESREVMVNLIAGTKTRTGLTVRVELDHDVYQKGIWVTDREMKQLPLVKHEFHGDWNYALKKSREEFDQESE